MSYNEMRAGHADRDATIDVLRTAAGDGYLTAELLDERITLALHAEFKAQLRELTADLDVPSAGRAVEPVTPAPSLARRAATAVFTNPFTYIGGVIVGLFTPVFGIGYAVSTHPGDHLHLAGTMEIIGSIAFGVIAIVLSIIGGFISDAFID